MRLLLLYYYYRDGDRDRQTVRDRLGLEKPRLISRQILMDEKMDEKSALAD